MKKKLLAIMNGDNNYLTGFKTKEYGVLAYTATWGHDFEHALLVDWKAVKGSEEHVEKLKKWAEAVGGKLVLIQVDYRITEFESGEERHSYIKPEITQNFKVLLQQLIGGDNDEN